MAWRGSRSCCIWQEELNWIEGIWKLFGIKLRLRKSNFLNLQIECKIDLAQLHPLFRLL